MALATNKLYVRRGGVTYALNLYTSTGDLEASGGIGLRIAGGTQYALLGSSGDSRASYLRIRKNGTVYSILTTGITYTGVWNYWGQAAQPANPAYKKTTSNSLTLTRTFDYNVVYSSTALYNFRVSWSTGNWNANAIAYYTIDGVQYSLTINGHNFHRLSTGSHTIVITWLKRWYVDLDASDVTLDSYSEIAYYA